LLFTEGTGSFRPTEAHSLRRNPLRSSVAMGSGKIKLKSVALITSTRQSSVETSARTANLAVDTDEWPHPLNTRAGGPQSGEE